MGRLYTCDQVKALDRAAIAQQGITSFALMRRAAVSAFAEIQRRWPDENQLSVYCGAGNNGGDGYVIAALAKAAGFEVSVLALKPPAALTGDALKAHSMAVEGRVCIEVVSSAAGVLNFEPGGVIVDALLGIGLTGKARGLYKSAIAQINHSDLPVLSVDIPSGLCGDTGNAYSCSVQATATMTFIALKQGLFTADAKDHVGDLVYANLGATTTTLDSQLARTQLIELRAPILPERSSNSHKGSFGRLLVIGGNKSMGGAAIMAAEAGLLSGAGIVHLATDIAHFSAALTRRPELMMTDLMQGADLQVKICQQSSTLIGPGLGAHPAAEALLNQLIKSGKPMVVDADALALLAKLNTSHAHWVLTPHPGEAARLLQSNTACIQQDRFAAVREIQRRYGGVVILKGAGTLIANEERVFVCDRGNPAMAAPGTGDVLAGLCGGFLAQGMALTESAIKATWAHATAGDSVVQAQGKHLLATELFDHIRPLL